MRNELQRPRAEHHRGNKKTSLGEKLELRSCSAAGVYGKCSPLEKTAS